MIDCRTCKNLSERSGGCMSVVKCISGSCYRDTAAVQLFEGPAPTVEPEYWIATDGGDMIAAFSRKDAWVDFCDEVSPLEAFPVYRHPPPAEVQAKPVAWMFDRRYGSGLSFGRPADYENEDGETVLPTPLYRHPPKDGGKA